MATRLNQEHREALYDLARRVVDCPDEAKAEDAAYKKAAPLVRKCVEVKYPAADMAVLSKYDLVRRDHCIQLQLTAGGVEEFEFRHDEPPPVVASRGSCYGRIHPADEKTTAAVSAWKLAKDANEKARDKKLEQYRAFVRSATTFEQVLEVWPEASALTPNIARNLPVAVSVETIDAIKADSARRIRQAARRAA